MLVTEDTRKADFTPQNSVTSTLSFDETIISLPSQVARLSRGITRPRRWNEPISAGSCVPGMAVTWGMRIISRTLATLMA